MMTCRDVEPLVTAFVDGELDNGRASALRGHMRSCEACHALVEDEAAVRHAAEQLDTPEPPSSMWDGVEARLAAAEMTDARRPRMWLWWQGVRRPVIAGSALAAAAALAIAWLAARRDPRTPVRTALAPAPQNAPTGAADRATGGRSQPTVDQAFRRDVARAEASYRRSIEELRAIADEERAAWSDEYAAAVDARLAELDAALERVRAATQDLDDPAASDALLRTYRAEYAALQDAVLGGGQPW